MKGVAVLGCAVLLLFLAVTPALAAGDATAFLGSTVTPSNRSARGFALGLGAGVLGVEFEYSSTSENPVLGAPSFRTGSANALLQTPFTVAGLQFYATAGVSVFRETLDTQRATNLAVNTGGGVKVTLAGPIRLRVDYRVFRLNGSALYSHPQRIYAGLNLRF